MRFVLDTNVVVSYLFFHNSQASKIVKHIIDNHEVLVSKDTIAELEYVINKPKLLKYATLVQVRGLLAKYKRVAKRIVVTCNVTACRDAKDNKFLELASDGNADFIVTGDNDLLIMKTFARSKIIRISEIIIP